MFPPNNTAMDRTVVYDATATANDSDVDQKKPIYCSIFLQLLAMYWLSDISKL